MSLHRVVLLTSEGESGRIAARTLARSFPDLRVIVEQPVPRTELLKRRIRRLGLIRVLGQLAFMLFQRAQEAASRKRIAEIKRQFGLDGANHDETRTIRVDSVNSPECLAAIGESDPGGVLVVGTRLINPSVLDRIEAPVINYHAGITPAYRGVHGGYWALAEGDKPHCGVTVHLVDAGIDTGGVLHQAPINPGSKDNFSTYPYLQLGAALPLLERAAREAMTGTLNVAPSAGPSRLWSHPTIWHYLAIGWQRGVW